MKLSTSLVATAALPLVLGNGLYARQYYPSGLYARDMPSSYEASLYARAAAHQPYSYLAARDDLTSKNQNLQNTMASVSNSPTAVGQVQQAQLNNMKQTQHQQNKAQNAKNAAVQNTVATSAGSGTSSSSSSVSVSRRAAHASPYANALPYLTYSERYAGPLARRYAAPSPNPDTPQQQQAAMGAQQKQSIAAANKANTKAQDKANNQVAQWTAETPGAGVGAGVRTMTVTPGTSGVVCGWNGC